MRNFIQLLGHYIDDFDGTEEELAHELTDAMDSLAKRKEIAESHTITRNLVGKHKSGKKIVTEYELKAYLEVHPIKDEDRRLLKELHKPYVFWNNNMNEIQRHQTEQISEVFKSFRDLSDLSVNPRPTPNYGVYSPFPDGLTTDKNDFNRSITTELIREFNKDNPTIDVFLPQNLDVYYDKIKDLFKSNLDSKTIRIRQILTFPKFTGKNAPRQEYDLLAFLPTIYFLTYAVPGSYHFYANAVDSVISETDGLITPYYICTSDCLIRFSQHLHTAWISHNETDISVYHQMFDARLSHTSVKPLIKKFKDYSEVIAHYSKEILSMGYTPVPCVALLASNELEHYAYVFDENLDETMRGVVNGFVNSIADVSSHYHFANKDSIEKFAHDGIIREYPEFLVPHPVHPQDRVLLLKKLNVANNNDYFVRNDVFNTNDKYCVCVSQNTVTVYPVGMDHSQFCVIDEKSIVTAFRFFFTEYLPNSDMIYSPQRAQEIIEKGIQIAQQEAEEFEKRQKHPRAKTEEDCK